MKLSAILATLFAVALFWAWPTVTTAQYLEPEVSVGCSLDQSGDDPEVTATVVDLQTNQPISGINVIFTSTPGSSVNQPSGDTNAAGEFTGVLDPGTVQGDVTVTAHVGDATCEITFFQEVLAETDEVASLPATGFGSEGGGTAHLEFVAAAAAVLGLMLLVGLRVSSSRK
jgi:hypothetical protein